MHEIGARGQIVEVVGFSTGINYGVDKVRFPSPVKVGDRVRAGAQLTEVSEVTNGLQTKIVITIEVDGSNKPACIIESLSRWLV